MVARWEYHNISTNLAQTDKAAMLKGTYKRLKNKGDTNGCKKVKKLYTEEKQKFSSLE